MNLKAGRRKVMQWFWWKYDDVTDKHPSLEHPRWDWLWSAFTWTQDKSAKMMCAVVGHEPERDQCNMPEHDFCVYCQKLLPFSYVPRDGV